MTDALTPETWTYQGRRADYTGDKLVHQWRDHTGTERQFDTGKKRGAAYSVGGHYIIECRETVAGGMTARLGGARYDGPSEDPGTDEWRLEDRAAVALSDAKAVETKAMRDDTNIGSLTLDEVAVMCRRPGKRAAIIAVVIQYLNR